MIAFSSVTFGTNEAVDDVVDDEIYLARCIMCVPLTPMYQS